MGGAVLWADFRPCVSGLFWSLSLSLTTPPFSPAPALQMKPTMLKKYIDTFSMPVRPDVNPNEMSIAVAR